MTDLAIMSSSSVRMIRTLTRPASREISEPPLVVRMPGNADFTGRLP